MDMRRVLALWAMMTVWTAVALGAPAKRVRRVVQQPDGTRLGVMLTGDEHLHCWRTADGVPVVCDGGWRYARVCGEWLVGTRLLAHEAEARSEAERQFVADSVADGEALAAMRWRRVAVAERRRAAVAGGVGRGVEKSVERDVKTGIAGSQPVADIRGARRGLVVLVNFKDVKMQAAHTREAFEAMFNEPGYGGNGNAGSVRDYFEAQSYGAFTPTFDVVGPVTVSKEMAAYGANDYDGNDKDPAGMVYEAVKLAKEAEPGLNFKDYDWNGDGAVDQVYVIYAGCSEAAGADANTIWPHEWVLSGGNYELTVDGVAVETYGCSSELYGTEDDAPRMDGIGTPCHEFSHCLGLPDLYDATGVCFGMDAWSVMDYGCYAGDGFAPVGYTAYERMVSGWLVPVELTADSAVTVTGMPALSERPVAYLMRNDGRADEYYLLENRQQRDCDATLEGHGLLVTHVDYDARVWEANEVNASRWHQRCTVVAADDSYNGRGSGEGIDKWTYVPDLDGDPFPGVGGVRSFTDSTRPAATWYNCNKAGEKAVGMPLTQITEDDAGLVSFDFMGGGRVLSGVKAVDTGAAPTDLVDVYTLSGVKVGRMTRAAFAADRGLKARVSGHRIVILTTR
mgnify:FL=1